MAALQNLQVQGPTAFSTGPQGPTGALRRQELDAALAAPLPLGGVSRFAGGTATDLDHQNAAALVMSARYQFTEASTGIVRIVRLVFGTQASAPPAATRTADFDATASPTVFVLEPMAGDDPRLAALPPSLTGLVYSTAGSPSQATDLQLSAALTTAMTTAPLGAIIHDGGLSGSDGSGNYFFGNSIYVGDSVSGAGMNGPSGAYFNDDGNQGWHTGGSLTVGGTVSASYFNYGNGSVLADFNTLYYSSGNRLADFDSLYYANGRLLADGDGNLTAQTLTVNGTAAAATFAGNGANLTGLAAANLTGIVPPARLGTGTPTSGTVLRGDGSWVGTTPTGNTVAASGNLLMGDGAGNAAGVSSDADLQRVLKLRLDSAVAVQSLPVNLLPTVANASIGQSFNGTLNADGTLTIPGSGSLTWVINGDAGGTQLYGYCVAVNEAGLPPNAVTMQGGAGSPHSTTTPLPGVYRSLIVSGNGNTYVVLVNNTASPVTIYFPVLSTLDTGLPLVVSFADHAAVAAQAVADLDFTHFASDDRSSRYLAEKQTTLAVDSVSGNNAAAGTLRAPKLSLSTQTLPTDGVLGLYRGGVWRDSLPVTNTTAGMVVQDVSLGSRRDLPVVSALDPVSPSAFTDNGDGTYSCLWTPAETLPASDGYGSTGAYIVEINLTAVTKGSPVSARRRMMETTSQAAVAALPGSAYILPPGTGSGQSGSSTQWKAIIQPSTTEAPSNEAYHYEVVSRKAPADFAPLNLRDAAMSGVELVGSSNGYGELSGTQSFVGDRLVCIHAAGHNAVIGGGSLQRSVFYEAGSPQYIALAWYTFDPTGVRWSMSHNLIYLNNGSDRVPNFVISHSGGNAYDRGDISDCAFLAARWSDGSLRGVGIDYVNVINGVINRVYEQGVADAFGGSMPPGVEIKNSVFRQVCHVNIGGSFHDNLVAAESGSNPADANYRSPTGWTFRSAGAAVTHNLFWVHGLATSVTNDGGAAAFGFYPGVTTGTATCNLIVLNPAAGTNSAYCQNLPSDVTGVSLDFNLVICTSPLITSGGARGSWADYRAAYPTLDVHSLFVDLSADPRGLQAVFVDPANGDFRWAQTDVARRCAAYCVANHVGPATVTSRWPLVPTVDEAVRLLTDL